MADARISQHLSSTKSESRLNDQSPFYLEKGNPVLFGKYAGNEIKIDGVEHLIMQEDAILGIVK